MEIKMNRRRMKRLRNFIAALPVKNFDMDEICKLDRPEETIKEALNPSCGTVGCLAGWSVLLFAPRKTAKVRQAQPFGRPGMIYNTVNVDGLAQGCDGQTPVVTRAAELLGLDSLTAGELFHGRWGWPNEKRCDDSPEQVKTKAVAALDRLLETGSLRGF